MTEEPYRRVEHCPRCDYPNDVWVEVCQECGLDLIEYWEQQEAAGDP